MTIRDLIELLEKVPKGHSYPVIAWSRSSYRPFLKEADK